MKLRTYKHWKRVNDSRLMRQYLSLTAYPSKIDSNLTKKRIFDLEISAGTEDSIEVYKVVSMSVFVSRVFFCVFSYNIHYNYAGVQLFDSKGQECWNVFVQGRENLIEALGKEEFDLMPITIAAKLLSSCDFSHEVSFNVG